MAALQSPSDEPLHARPPLHRPVTLWPVSAWAVAWIVGVAIQVQQPYVWRAAVYGVMLLVALIVWAGMLWWHQRSQRCTRVVAYQTADAAAHVSRPGHQAHASVVYRAMATPWMQLAWQCIAVGMLAFSLTGLRASWYTHHLLAENLQGRDVVVTGTVTGLPRWLAGSSRFVLEVDNAYLPHAPAQPVPMPQRLALSWYCKPLARDTDSDLARHTEGIPCAAHVWPGQRWQLVVRLKQPHGNHNPAGFDYELWLWQNRLGATGYVRHAQHRLADAPPWYALSRWMDRARVHIRGAIERTLVDDQASVEAAAISTATIATASGVPIARHRDGAVPAESISSVLPEQLAARGTSPLPNSYQRTAAAGRPDAATRTPQRDDAAAPSWPDSTANATDVTHADQQEATRRAGIVAALVMGDQSAIEREDWDVFRRTGVAHLMSISGLHITMFAWLAAGVLGWLWRRSAAWYPALCMHIPAQIAGIWGGVLLSALYAWFSGWGVPAQRTVCMLVVVACLRQSSRQWPWHGVWVLAAAAVLAWDPWAWFQPGFWLSFVAVAVLFMAAPEAGRFRQEDTLYGDIRLSDNDKSTIPHHLSSINMPHAPADGVCTHTYDGGTDTPEKRCVNPITSPLSCSTHDIDSDKKPIPTAYIAQETASGADQADMAIHLLADRAGTDTCLSVRRSAVWERGQAEVEPDIASTLSSDIRYTNKRNINIPSPCITQQVRVESAAALQWARLWRWVCQRAMAVGWSVIQLVRTQLVVTLALAPLTLLLFGQVSLVGLVANVLAVPWVTLLLTPLALLGVVLPPLWHVADGAVGLLMRWLQWLADWPLAVYHGTAAPWWLVLVAVLATIALLMRHWPCAWRTLGLCVLLAVPLWQIPRPAPGQFEVLAADVGQGSALLVRTHRHTLLFDTGPRYGHHSDAGQRVLLPLLAASGEVLHMVVLSHADSDHIGGAPAVLQAWPQADVLASLPASHPIAQQRTILPCVAGQYWDWDGVRFEMLHPWPEQSPARAEHPTTDTNAMSCVLRISNGQHSALLTGDVGLAQEAAMLTRYAHADLRSTVLVVAHHGSQTSTGAAWLQAVQPQWGIIQHGFRNAYRHPHPDVERRLLRAGVQIVRSDTCGAARWQSEGNRMHCQRQQQRHYWHYPFASEAARHPPGIRP